MDFQEIKVGMKAVVSEAVTTANTAVTMGSGSLPVYATPAMICLMEKAAAGLLEPLLPDGWTTVGIAMDVQHKAPSPEGAAVRAEAEVTAVEGRKVTFSVRAWDVCGEIGCGRHERFAVRRESFMEKASSRH